MKKSVTKPAAKLVVPVSSSSLASSSVKPKSAQPVKVSSSDAPQPNIRKAPIAVPLNQTPNPILKKPAAAPQPVAMKRITPVAAPQQQQPVAMKRIVPVAAPQQQVKPLVKPQAKPQPSNMEMAESKQLEFEKKNKQFLEKLQSMKLEEPTEEEKMTKRLDELLDLPKRTKEQELEMQFLREKLCIDDCNSNDDEDSDEDDDDDDEDMEDFIED